MWKSEHPYSHVRAALSVCSRHNQTQALGYPDVPGLPHPPPPSGPIPLPPRASRAHPPHPLLREGPGPSCLRAPPQLHAAAPAFPRVDSRDSRQAPSSRPPGRSGATCSPGCRQPGPARLRSAGTPIRPPTRGPPLSQTSEADVGPPHIRTRARGPQRSQHVGPAEMGLQAGGSGGGGEQVGRGPPSGWEVRETAGLLGPLCPAIRHAKAICACPPPAPPQSLRSTASDLEAE
ncbi:formin-like protein 5 [Canis lupus familiaris]|uniref:formin-like protein 5 n=1 Tax=Canis lupus familiaris TaxID=9615 RepID=UPI0018F52748|nr:formin-like protein 5 [Canis lupus familiaris]